VIESVAVYFALILARVGTFVATMPLFAQRTPRLVRAGLAMALAVFYFSAVAPRWDASFVTAPHWSGWPFLLVILREMLIGGVFGLAMSLFLLPAQVAGAFISNQVGLAVGPVVGASENHATGALAAVLEIFAALIFLELDGHHFVLTALHGTFAAWPLGGLELPQTLETTVAGLARAHEAGARLAGPIALSLWLLTIVLAFLARAAPQLNIQSIGFTLQSLAVLLGTAFLLPELTRVLAWEMGWTMQRLPRFLE
jgi:flagellar biosynthetic protein FliR